MSIDEAIKQIEEIAEDNQKVVDTHRFADMLTIEEIYCDDTEIIEEQLAGYQKCAEEHRQLAEWLKELKQLREQTKWIPVTENTPPKGTICLWCNEQGSVFISAITYRSERNSYVGKHGYFSNGLENYGNIVAWRPLPEAYQEESEIN